MTIARISYANTEPFFHFWDTQKFSLVSGVPRQLAEKAAQEQILAGPLPLVECWKLEDRYSPLENWGIVATNRCQSVFVFSDKPFSELENSTLGMTHDSSTSVALCQVLLEQKYQKKNIRFHRGLDVDDDAWLVIGDQALKMAHSPEQLSHWTYITDLATEWWNWKNLPFVFARWVYRNNMESEYLQQLSKHISDSLKKGQYHLKEIAEKEAQRLSLPSTLLYDYLKGFEYELNSVSEESIKIFQTMVEQTQLRPTMDVH